MSFNVRRIEVIKKCYVGTVGRIKTHKEMVAFFKITKYKVI